MKRLLILAAFMASSATGAFAQDPVLPPQAPNMPAPKDIPAEKIKPQEPSETGSAGTLSDKLERSDGVIRPPETGTPDMNVRPPVPNPGTTPVIPAPGSPGGNPSIEPR